MDSNKRVLIVEDDLHIAELLRMHLRDEGYVVEHAADGHAGLRELERSHWDALVLDLMLPGIDGLEICRRARAMARYTPIIIISARSSEVHRILGLELGADDYLAKPVQPRVLLARIKALLRRLPAPSEAASGETDNMVFGQFKISQATRTASLSGHTIDLTTAEFDLLWLLASHAGNVLSRDDLLQELRGIGFDGLDRSIDARISRLRKKLNDDPENPTRIKTVRGKGYLFSKHDWN